jgi:polyisoprenoid-binding protein YceI
VKKKADKTYTATATVAFRGVTKKYPVTFNVTDTQADSIHIHAEQTFQRGDFNVGKVSTDPKVAPVQNDLVLQMELTLKKT